MCAFYVVRKHTVVRHNKWSDGAIREGFVDGVRSSKARDTLIALSDSPVAFVYELIKHCSTAAGASSPPHPYSTMMTLNGYCRAFTAPLIR